ncbi:MAG: lytic transglycosylase domain-containing protein [Clostridiales bacterium]|nr:lytic transglycosylase domain-containing protein [Clostridiales bacterium]
MKKYWIVIIVILSVVIVGISTIFMLFPLKYKDLIIKYSKEYGLHAYLVASVINIESRYDKNAKSSAGAIGLMQLLPSTAEEVSKKLNIDFETSDLYLEEVNIQMGCYYLSYLLDYYNGNAINSLSAYNWGLNNVNNWLDLGNVDENGTITNIPVSETSNYLKKFKINEFVYKIIFKE